MENKEEKNREPRKMQDMMKGVFKEGMKDDVMKGLKRSGIALIIVVVCWVVFISLHSFFCQQVLPSIKTLLLLLILFLLQHLLE